MSSKPNPKKKKKVLVTFVYKLWFSCKCTEWTKINRTQKGDKENLSTNKIKHRCDLTTQHVWLSLTALNRLGRRSAGVSWQHQNITVNRSLLWLWFGKFHNFSVLVRTSIHPYTDLNKRQCIWQTTHPNSETGTMSFCILLYCEC